MKVKLLRIIPVFAVSVLFFGCDIIFPAPPGVIEFPDYNDQRKLVGGNAGLMDFGAMLVPDLPSIDPPRNVMPLKIKNSGEGQLEIINIHMRQTAAPEDNPADAADAFSFVDNTFPVLPLVIPAGGTVSDIFTEFLPETAGGFRARLFIETEDDTYYVDLVGTGLWQLTLHGHNDGILTILSDDGGSDLSVDGAADTPAVSTSLDGVFSILCEADFLSQFEQWHDNSAADSSVAIPDWLSFDNEKAVKTTVVLSDHAAIKAFIIDPYVYLGTGYPDAEAEQTRNLNSAIVYCNSQSDKIAVIAEAGTYTVTNADFITDIPVYGGYSGFTVSDDRQYLTAADRTNPVYQSILNVSGTINVSGSGLLNNVVLEGFTINKTGGGDTPPVRFDNGTTAELRYNTITGGGTNSSAAVLVTNDAAPLIKYNYLTGGNVSADYAGTYGLQITEGASPVVYKNSIKGGTASGTDATSFGIFCDFEAEPYVRNNTTLDGVNWGISGGAATGSGGKSYGIYIINNGNLLAEYNTISGGSGKTAIAMYSRYGSFIDAYHNNIFTGGGSTRIGVWADFSGRVYHLEHNGIYDCAAALYKDPYAGSLTSIDAVNSKYHTSTNEGAAVDLSEAPPEGDYE